MPALTDLLLPETSLRPEPALLSEVGRRTLATLERVGVVRSDRMTLAQYRAERFELLTALTYPHADVDELTLVNDFHVYLTYVDERTASDPRFRKSPKRLQLHFESHVAALRDGFAVDEDDAAGRLVLDIHDRLLPRATRSWLRRLADDLRWYLLRGTAAGARHFTANTVRGVAEYVEQRGWDSPVYCMQDFLEVAGVGELADHLLCSDDFRELRRLCTSVVAFGNDLVAYRQELPRPGANLVRVIMRHERCDLDEALRRAIAIVNRDVAAFEQLAARLPAAGTLGQRVQRYLAGQRAWMAGGIAWSVLTGRYDDPQSPLPELRGSHAASPLLSSGMHAIGTCELPATILPRAHRYG